MELQLMWLRKMTEYTMTSSLRHWWLTRPSSWWLNRPGRDVVAGAAIRERRVMSNGFGMDDGAARVAGTVAWAGT